MIIILIFKFQFSWYMLMQTLETPASAGSNPTLGSNDDDSPRVISQTLNKHREKLQRYA
jgi:hypothetical protein